MTKTYPLLKSQLGIFMDCVKYPESRQFFLPSYTKLTDNVDLDAVEKGLQEIYANRKELRVLFKLDEDGNPVQYVSDAKLQVTRKKVKSSDIDAFAKEFFARKMDPLGTEPLVRFELVETDKGNYLLGNYHHIIMDGESSGRLFTKRDMSAAYKGHVVPEDYGMLEYIDEHPVDSVGYERDKKYYAERFAQIPMSTLSAGNVDPLGNIIMKSAFLDADEIENFSDDQELSVDGLFQAAFSHVISSFLSQKKIAYTIAISGRFDQKIKESYGMYVENLPLLIEEKEDMTCRQLINDCVMEKMKSIRHHHYPFTDFCRDLGTEPGIGYNFFSTNENEEYFYFGEERCPTKIPIDYGTSDLLITIFKSNNQYEIRAQSSEKLNDMTMLETVVNSIRHTVLEMIEKVDEPLTELSVLPASEEKEIAKISAGERFETGTKETFVDKFITSAKTYPDHLAVVDKYGTYTYKELDDISNSIAAYLLDNEVKAGEFVAVRMNRVKEFAASVIGIMKAGAAYVPIDEDYPKDRIKYMMEDSGARITLTKESVLEIAANYKNAAPINNAKISDHAYMIYTSGSTGMPKGVIQSHRSLSHFVSWRTDKLDIRNGKAYGHFSNFSFDASLDDLACPLSVGATTHIFDEELRTSITGICSYIEENNISGLTLSTLLGMELIKYAPDLKLEYLMMGGEALLPTNKTSYKIINGYGPTEFTVCSSYYEVTGDETTIPIGRPVPGTSSYICDMNGKLLPKGITGELCLSGPQMADGYRNQEDLDKEKFVSIVVNGKQISVYRTGDMARYNADNLLEYKGRVDNQIKIRGFRVELGEVEGKAAQFAGVGSCVCDVRKDKLILYYVVKTNKKEDKQFKENLSLFMEEALPDYMVPTYYVQVDAIPESVNGKVDKKQLPDPVSSDVLMVAPETEMEEKVLDLISEILKEEHFGVTDDIIGLGLTSISIMKLSAMIKKELGKNITVSEIMKSPRVRDIAKILEKESASDLHITHVEQFYYPITENQRGVYLDWEKNRNAVQYNIPSLYEIKDVDPKRLAGAVKTAVSAHRYLETRFEYIDGDLMQKFVSAEPEVKLTTVKTEPDADYFQKKVKPFDLLNDRLYRIEIVSYKDRTWLFIDAHHIIYDGLSNGLLMRGILDAYDGKAVKPEEITAFDYALYEQKYRESEKYSEDKQYFDELLSDGEAAVYPDSCVPDGKGVGHADVIISKKNIEEYCRDKNITEAAFMQAAVAEALKRLVRRDKLVYVTASGGRGADTRLLDSVGMYVRTVPVAVETKADANELTEDFISGIYGQMKQSLACELYPYTEMVSSHDIKAEIMFTFQGGILESGRNKRVSQIPLSLGTSKFPIVITVYPESSKYRIEIEYDKARYGLKDMEQLAAALGQCATTLVEQKYLKDVRLITEKEEKSVAKQSSGKPVKLESDTTWVDLFIKMAAKYPDKTAVVDSSSSMTYEELDRNSNAVAAYCIEKGLKPGDFVGVKFDRVKEVLTALIGIQRAGAAGMPMDSAYPEERIRYMMEDSGAKLIITLEDVQKAQKKYAYEKPINISHKDKKAYLLYTSGSTGKPKGAVLTHEGLRYFVRLMEKDIGIKRNGSYGVLSPLTFDGSLIDYIGSLSIGATVHIFSEDLRKNLEGINKYVEKNHINGFFASTQLGLEIIRHYPNIKLDYLMIGGEKLPSTKLPKARLINIYGPTECTMFVTHLTIEDGSVKNIPIGNVHDGHSCFVCDSYGNLLPMGAIGELCLAGPQIGLGYWNREELTAEKFPTIEIAGEKVRVFRTGDLVRYNQNGEIEYHGRIDHMVKLRGFRIELGEVETCACKYDSIDMAVAAVKNDMLVLYYQPKKGMKVDEKDLKAFMGKTLASYMVPVVFMKLDKLPLNANGKINRLVLPEPEVSGLEKIQPQNKLETDLIDQAYKILGTENFGVTDDLVSQGMSSIAMMRFVAAIQQNMGVKIALSDIMKAPTIRGIADKLGANSGIIADKAVITSYGTRDHYPITENQRGVYLEWEKNRGTLQYNVPSLYLFEDKDATELAKAVEKVIDSHQYLKTRLEYVDGDLVQKPGTEKAKVPVFTLKEEPDTAFFQKKVCPFDLLNDKLYRAEVVTFENKTWLFTDIHHIIYDGLSTGIFGRDVISAYEGREITSEAITAYDFAIFEKEYVKSKSFSACGKYFDKLLKGAEAAVYPEGGPCDGYEYGTVLTRMKASGIDAFCRKHGVTAASFMQAAFAECLKRICRVDKCVYATISNGRSIDSQLMNCVGMFARTLPVVSYVGDESQITAIDYIKSVYAQMQATMECELYPYTRIVEQQGIKAEVMYAFQGGLFEGGVTNGATQIPLLIDTVKFPVSVTVYPEDGDYVTFIEYDGQRYNRADMETFARSIENAAKSLMRVEHLGDVELISELDRKAIMKLSAGDKLDYKRTQTWMDKFLKICRTHSDKTAVTDEKGSITYAQLNEQSDIVANYLISHKVREDDFVAVMMDRSLEFVIAVVGIHKAGAAYVPIDIAYPKDRIDYMLEDSGAKLVLTEDKIRTIVKEKENTKAVNLASPERLAYMIYTSGTTGKPKGAMLHHKGLMNFVELTIRHNELTDKDRIGHHFSFSFDSHIEDVFPVLATGAGMFIMPESIRREPKLIYEFLKKNKITGCGFTTSIGKMLAKSYDLDMRYMTLIGEPLTDLVSTGTQIMNKYGPTECTNIISMFNLEKDTVYKRIPIGRPVANGYLFVVDATGHLLPRSVPGEICYAGPQVGRGYWKQKEKTKEVFEECPFIKGVSMYHTGDLGRYNKDGLLECLGRIDNQIKINGFRVELGEVETRASHFEGIQTAAAAVKQGKLILYYVPKNEKTIDEDKLGKHMALSLADYMLPSQYVCLEAMPYTPSGKVNRKALPDPVWQNLEMVAPASDLEKNLFEIATEVLGTDKFGVTDDMVGLGMSSIAMMRFVAKAQKDLGRKISVAQMMKTPVIRDLAGALEGGDTSFASQIKVNAPRDFYPITENQRGIYLAWEMNKESLQYNVPSLLVLEGMDADKVADAARAAVDAHSYLKTRFAFNLGELVQKPCDEEAVVERTDFDKDPDVSYFQGKVRSFDLLNDRLYRIEVASYKKKTYLFVDCHHILYDGLSNGLLLREIISIAKGNAATGEFVSAYDFALFEGEYLKSKEYAESKAYYGELLSGMEAASYPNSPEPDGSLYSRIEYRFGAKDIDDYCRDNKVTTASFMQAAFALTANRATRQDNLIYATISNGRGIDARLLSTMGMFVRTLPVAVGIPEDGSLETSDFVQKVSAQMQKTMGHELYPYTRIVEDTGLHAEMLFVFQGGLYESGEVEGTKQIPLSLDGAKFPISVTVYPEKGDLVIMIEYDGMRYSQKDMTTFATAVGNTALSLTKEKELKAIGLANREQEKEALKVSVGEVLKYDRTSTWLDMFKSIVQSSPDSEAVEDDTSSLSYKELDERSDEIAAYIEAQNINPGSFVAVKVGRVKEFAVAVVGIHKAGAAYVPIDESYPADRIQYMLEDSMAEIVLTESLIKNIYKEYAGKRCKKENLARPESIAYMIYTSGSTGKPKGAMVVQSGILNLVQHDIRRMKLNSKSRVAIHTSFSFDVTGDNFFPTLSSGGCLVIIPERVRKDVDLLYAFFREHKVTGTHITTQIGQLLGAQYDLEMDYIRLSGEAMTSVPKCKGRVFNTYGPTECTVDVTDIEIPRGFDGKIIPIGKPMAGCNVYVVDKANHLLPNGMAGELYLGGENVGAGYFNKPDLTAEKFIDFTINGRVERVYKSGDLGRYLPNGDIEYMGRLDNQIKFRGFRIELGEIENRALAFDGIEQAVALVKNEQLVLYYSCVNGKKVDTKELGKFLAKELTDYMIPTVYVLMDDMPLTPNGKVNRKALPEPEIEGFMKVEPETELEKQLLDLAYKAIGSSNFGVTDDLLGAGMSSIVSMRFAAAINKELGRKITVTDILKTPTIRDVATMLDGGADKKALGIPDYEEQEYYPISENQRGIYVEWELNRSTLQYNVPNLYVFEGVDAKRLAGAVAKAIDAHPYLSTRIVFEDGELMQKRRDEEPQILFNASPEEPPVEEFQKRVQPFILIGDRLYRIGVIAGPKKTWLFMDIHHIIYDGISAGVLMRDIMAAYNGQILEKETVSGCEYALFEQDYIKGQAYNDAKTYFDKLLSGAEAASYMDSVKPDGKAYGIINTKTSAKTIDKYCKKNKVTAASFMQAAFSETLKRVTRQDKSFYVTISSGRSADTRLMNSVGMFARTLPVLVDRSASPADTLSFVRDVNEQMRATTANELYPYTKIATDLGEHAQIMYIFQGGLFEGGQIDGIEQIALSTDTTKFAIAVTVYPEGDDYNIAIEYDGNRYSEEDMKIFAEAIAQTSQSLAKEEQLSAVQTVDKKTEKALFELSKGEKAAENKATWIDMFVASAEKYPEHVAVIDNKGSLTYKELNERSDALACYLISQKVKENSFVAVKMDRCKELVIAALGIMKARAAYVPVDPEYPPERIRYMLEDSGAKVVVTQEIIDEAVARNGKEKINLPTLNNYAYMIYTSGSTGRPKGVVQSHRSLGHFASWRTKALAISPDKNYGHFNSFAFDGSLDDLVCPLAVGATLHIFSEDLRRNIPEMDEYIAEHKIAGLTVSTLIGMELMKYDQDLDLDYLMMGGEKLLPSAATAFKVINGYGPTEFTVCSSYYVVNGDEEDIPIGRAVPGTLSLVCDPYGKLLPQQMVGELYLAGPQIAEGYWNQDELTRDRFVEITVAGNKLRAYKTGDLVRYNADDQLEYVGRIDDQVKLRGFRVEFGEIEKIADDHYAVEQAVADVRKNQLILYFTLKEAMKASLEADKVSEDLRKYMAKKLADYMVPSIFVALDAIPMTVNGKVDRKALPMPEIMNEDAYVEPETKYEEIVADAMQEALGMTDKVSVTAGFQALGGDSIKGIRLVSILHNKGIQLRIGDILSLQTARDIAAKVEKEMFLIDIDQNPIEGEIEDSAIVAFYKDLDLPQGAHFTQQILLGMKKRAEIDKLKESLKAIFYQHDLLRAVYRDGKLLVNGVSSDVPLEEYTAKSDSDVARICSDVKNGINMEKALVRVALIHGNDQDMIFIVAHHLIIDGVSWRIIVQDLEKAYKLTLRDKEITLDSKTSTYRDYVNALKTYRNSDVLASEIPYWNKVQEKLSSMPYSDAKDYNRTFGSVSLKMDKSNTMALLGAKRDVIHLDMNDVLITAAARAYCQEEKVSDVSIQLEGHGREDISEMLATDRTVGWFTSIYPVVLSGITGGMGDDLKADLVLTKETLHRVPVKGVGYNILRFIDGDNKVTYSADHIAKISFNYLGEMDDADRSGGYFEPVQGVLELPEFAYSNPGENGFGSDININCVVTGGNFGIDITYNEAIYSKNKIESIAENILTQLQDEVLFLNAQKETIYTAEDYQEKEWSQKEFDYVMNEVTSAGEAIESIRPLSQAEADDLTQILEGSDISKYNYAGVFKVGTKIGEEDLQKTLDKVNSRFTVVNTAFAHENVEADRLVFTSRRLTATFIDAGKSDPEKEAMKLHTELLDKKVNTLTEQLFNVFCITGKDDESFLVIACHPVISACTGLTGYLLSSKVMSYLADITKSNFKLTDMLGTSFVRKLERKGMRVFEYYNEYDPEKPTMVIVLGIVLQMSIQHFVDDWCRRFNVIVVEDINYNYNELFPGENFDEVSNSVVTLLELSLPKDDGIFGFIGYSFGGELGHSLASKIRRIRGSAPTVFLGDSDMVPSQGESFAKTYKHEDLDEFLVQKFEENNIPEENMLFAYSMLSFLNAGPKTFECYEGLTILLLAIQNNTQEEIEIRIALAKQNSADFRVIDFPDRDHFSLHNDPGMIPTYDKIFVDVMNERGLGKLK